MTKKIKLFDPYVDRLEREALLKTFQSHFWASGAGGGNVLKFEKEFKRYLGTKSCIALNSGTAALHLALSLSDIKNKEVILPSLSFVSTANAVLYNGGKPIFVDIDPNTLCIDPQNVKKKISNNTRVVLPVHFGGMPCELDELKIICEENNMVLIEDAAHAVGSSYKNKRIGSQGDLVCFSFHPVKNLAMPTGGAITLNNKNYKKMESALKSLRWCGISNRSGPIYDVKVLGYNYYMNEFSAVIGLVQLKKLEGMNSLRKKIAMRYFEEIELKKKMPFSNDCAYHLYWIQVKNRMKFIKKMDENNVEVGVHYRPIHRMQLYKTNLKLPETERVGEHIISLPVHPNLTDSDVSKVIRLVNKFA